MFPPSPQHCWCAGHCWTRRKVNLSGASSTCACQRYWTSTLQTQTTYLIREPFHPSSGFTLQLFDTPAAPNSQLLHTTPTVLFGMQTGSLFWLIKDQCMQLNTAVIYFPESNKDIYIYIYKHIS